VGFAIKAGVDLLVLPFVHSGQHVKDLRALLKRRGTFLPLIAKIETRKPVNTWTRFASKRMA